MNTSQLAALRWMMERELSALRSPRMSPEISLKCPDENELASRLSERAVDERLTARRVERHWTLRVPGVQCRRVPSPRLCPFSCPGADRQAIDSSRINGFF